MKRTIRRTPQRVLGRPCLRTVLGTMAATLACGSILASVLLAKPGVIKTTSGQTYDGNITEQGDSYIVTVDKVNTRVLKSDVASVQYPGSIDDQFSQRMSKLDAKDANGRVALARFAFDNGRYDLAVQALSSALLIDPKNAAARDMLKTVQAQQQLEHSRDAARATTPAMTPAPAPTTGPAGAVPGAPIAKRLLTPADINSIRQQEIKPGETVPISMTIDVKRKAAAKVGMTFSAFSDLTASDQLKKILDLGDPDLAAAVKIGRDPQALAQFKRIIQPLVLRNCATSGCHGGPAGGKFILYSGNDDATTYTNFYIMERYAKKETPKSGAQSGVFGGAAERKLIQRGNGAKSLLVNYGLPSGAGDIDHPKVKNSGFNGVFRSADDNLYRQVVDWMDSGLNMIEPSYGIKFAPPTGPTSKPTTMP